MTWTAGGVRANAAIPPPQPISKTLPPVVSASRAI